MLSQIHKKHQLLLYLILHPSLNKIVYNERFVVYDNKIYSHAHSFYIEWRLFYDIYHIALNWCFGMVTYIIDVLLLMYSRTPLQRPPSGKANASVKASTIINMRLHRDFPDQMHPSVVVNLSSLQG